MHFVLIVAFEGKLNTRIQVNIKIKRRHSDEKTAVNILVDRKS